MNISDAVDLLKEDLSKFLGFALPNKIGSGLQFYNIASEFAERVIAAKAMEQNGHNSDSTKLRKIIIELGCRGVIGASERDTAIVDEICKREGIVL